MLRLLLLALILANGAYYAWSHALLRAWGLAPALQSEPQRMAQQIKPDSLRVLSAAEIKTVEAQVAAEREPRTCLQAGPFDDTQAATLRHALDATLTGGTWQFDPVVIPARWIIYMGKYPNSELRQKKQAELAAMNLTTEPLQNPSLEIGLSLGGFDSQAAATARLGQLNQRGIHTAHVVQERTQFPANRLRLPSLTESQKSRLGEIKAALAGRTLTNCP